MEEMKKLIGTEIEMWRLDNYAMDAGYYSCADDGVFGNCIQDGNIVYTGRESGECEMRVYFDVVYDASEDEDVSASVIKVKEVEKFY